jgi:ABC-type lipoprotein export system ATPase subunit
MTCGMLCTQALGFLIGIICVEYEHIAIGVSVGIYLMLVMLSNIFIPVKEMPQIFQMMSNISFTKLIYYSVLIIVYGLGRCRSDQLSLGLFKHDIDDNLFWIYVKYLPIYSIILRILAYFVLYFKANTIFEMKKFKNILNKWFVFSLDSKRDIESEKESEFSNNNNIEDSAIFCTSNKSLEVINTEKLSEEENENKLSIAWIDLSLKIQKKIFTKEKIILRQLNGFFEFGSLNALMGPSGAGKTSLLKCLNGRNQLEICKESKIYLSRFRKIRTCFVSQDVSEHLINGLTAKQSMIYASKLKNPIKGVDHEIIVKNLMNELLISDIEGTNVEKCSSGEQKRLVIAMELTSGFKLNLMFIDEPTIGLDSNSAEEVRFFILFI